MLGEVGVDRFDVGFPAVAVEPEIETQPVFCERDVERQLSSDAVGCHGAGIVRDRGVGERGRHPRLRGTFRRQRHGPGKLRRAARRKAGDRVTVFARDFEQSGKLGSSGTEADFDAGVACRDLTFDHAAGGLQRRKPDGDAIGNVVVKKLTGERPAPEAGEDRREVPVRTSNRVRRQFDPPAGDSRVVEYLPGSLQQDAIDAKLPPDARVCKRDCPVDPGHRPRVGFHVGHRSPQHDVLGCVQWQRGNEPQENGLHSPGHGLQFNNE